MIINIPDYCGPLSLQLEEPELLFLKMKKGKTFIHYPIREGTGYLRMEIGLSRQPGLLLKPVLKFTFREPESGEWLWTEVNQFKLQEPRASMQIYVLAGRLMVKK